jgi:hypothetical protein
VQHRQLLALDGREARRRLAVVERSPDVIARIAVLLTTLGDEARDWMEWLAVSLVFIEGNTVLAEYGVLSGCPWVRTPTDGGDRAVARSGELSARLDAVGVDTGPA